MTGKFYKDFLSDIEKDMQALKTVSGFVVSNYIGEELCADGAYRNTYTPMIVNDVSKLSIPKGYLVEPVNEWAERQIQALKTVKQIQ